jgi:YidC/Oxa1 family membrane protein insertase
MFGLLRAWSGWRAYRKLPSDWRHIVFYSESGQDWHHFEPLIRELTTTLGQQVTYVSSDPGDPGLKLHDPHYRSVCIPEGFFLTLHFQMQKADVVVLTMMDLDNLHLKRSVYPLHYIYVFHGMGSTHMVDFARSYDAYDSLFCVGPHHLAEIRKREEIHDLPAKNLFEYGYPRLERLMAEAVEFGNVAEKPEHPVVLVAPTWGDDSILNRCGAELIRVLLSSGHHVIMRPHYHTHNQTPEVIEVLLAEFSPYPNFEYIDAMGEKETLFRSHILVCDWSAMAIEYALGLEKPVLFIDLPRRVRNPDWQELGIEPIEAAIRTQIGSILSTDNLDAAPRSIAELLDAPDVFRQKAASLRESLVFNLGRSVPLAAREITRLADQQGQAHG